MTKETLHIKLDARDPDLSRLREVARGCREGKVVAFPTETVYGIGLPMSVSGATQKLNQLKQRPATKPYSFHISDWAMIEMLGVKRNPVFRYLSRQFWPGPLTLLTLNEAGETIGIRYPQSSITSILINTVGEPFLGTSANLSGQASPFTAEDVLKSFDGEVEYLLDGGKCELSADSTIVDLSGESPKIVRRGAKAEEIEAALDKVKAGNYPRKKILIVCTGNSCRSPMAEGWLRSELKRKNLDQKIDVSSCGVGTRDGMPATQEAILVMKNREIDISSHRSRVCTREDVLNADLVVAMSQEHSNFILGMVPSARGKMMVLNISDPIGMGLMIYEDVANSFSKKFQEQWDKIVAGVA